MNDARRPTFGASQTTTATRAAARAATRAQPWELGRRYMRGELDAADFLDQASRVLPVRLTIARAIAGFLGLFVAISYVVLALYLLSAEKPIPAALSLVGALAVGTIATMRWRR